MTGFFLTNRVLGALRSLDSVGASEMGEIWELGAVETIGEVCEFGTPRGIILAICEVGSPSFLYCGGRAGTGEGEGEGEPFDRNCVVGSPNVGTVADDILRVAVGAGVGGSGTVGVSVSEGASFNCNSNANSAVTAVAAAAGSLDISRLSLSPNVAAPPAVFLLIFKKEGKRGTSGTGVSAAVNCLPCCSSSW